MTDATILLIVELARAGSEGRAKLRRIRENSDNTALKELCALATGFSLFNDDLDSLADKIHNIKIEEKLLEDPLETPTPPPGAEKTPRRLWIVK